VIVPATTQHSRSFTNRRVPVRATQPAHLMLALNSSNTAFFLKLIDRMEGNSAVQFQLPEHMVLFLQKARDRVATPYGEASIYRLAQTYIQAGDIMNDPEMQFLFFDHRRQPDETDMVTIYAMYYANDSLGIAGYSMILEDGNLYLPKGGQLQISQNRFAADWLRQIKGWDALRCPVKKLGHPPPSDDTHPSKGPRHS
jgi:hypothetical protein